MTITNFTQLEKSKSNIKIYIIPFSFYYCVSSNPCPCLHEQYIDILLNENEQQPSNITPKPNYAHINSVHTLFVTRFTVRVISSMCKLTGPFSI